MPKKASNTRSKNTAAKRPVKTVNANANRRVKSAPAPENITVYGIYGDTGHIESGLRTLRNAGFPRLHVAALKDDRSRVRAAEARFEEDERGAMTAASIAGRITGCLAGVALFGPLVLATPILAGLASSAGFGEQPLRRALEPFQQAKAGMIQIECKDMDLVQKAVEILESTGARDVSASLTPVADGEAAERLKAIAESRELKAREYRDDEGVVHHHTRTFVEQHKDETGG